MASRINRSGRFTGYTVEDCACKYCLYYQGKKKGCTLEICCCEEERQQALAREARKAHKRSKRCHG